MENNYAFIKNNKVIKTKPYKKVTQKNKTRRHNTFYHRIERKEQVGRRQMGVTKAYHPKLSL